MPAKKKRPKKVSPKPRAVSAVTREGIMRFAHRLEMRLAARRIGKGDFVDRIGVRTTQTLRSYAYGTHDVKGQVLRRMAEVLDCSADYLLGLVDETQPGIYLQPGHILIDEAAVEAVRAAETADDLSPYVDAETGRILWQWRVPERCRRASEDEFRKLHREMEDRITKLERSRKRPPRKR